MNNWKRLIGKFIDAKITAGWNESTVEVGARWLNKFLRWCTEQGLNGPAAVTAAHLNDYRQFLLCTPAPRTGFYTLNSVDQAMRVVRQFFFWATTQQHVLFNPAQDLILPRIETRIPQLTLDEIAKLLTAAENGGTPDGIRNRAMLETFYAGVRRCECLKLEVEDADPVARLLRVRGRSGERWVAMSETLQASMERYLTEVRPAFATDASRRVLFLARNGSPFSEVSLAQMTKRLSDQLGLRVASHILRHTCALHMLDGGADLAAVQQQLGHQALRTTTSTYKQIATAAVNHRKRTAKHPRSLRLTHFHSLTDLAPDEAQDA